MGISIIVHFSGWFPPNIIVLVFIYFNNYPTVACIDVEYHPIYIFIRDKACQSIHCNTVPKAIVCDHTQLLWFIYDFRSAASVHSRHLCLYPINWEKYHSSYQARFIVGCILNPSDDMGDYPILILFFGTDRAGDPSLSIS